MNHREKERAARQIRSSIKAIVAQLDSWNSDQRELRLTRDAANEQSGGRRQRLAESRALACASQGTQFVQDPPCATCGSSSHLSEECDFIAVESNDNEGGDLSPASSIHRGIVHRLYVQSLDLYRLSYPRYYPGPSDEVLVAEILDTSPVPLIVPDYQAIALSKATSVFLSLSANWVQRPTVRDQQALLDQVIQPFHSAAFPLDFLSFRAQVYYRWAYEQDESQQT
jgi:hypothetical protein